MIAKDYCIGQRFKNIHTKDIWMVIDVGDDILFENGENGDASEFLDEDNFTMIYE